MSTGSVKTIAVFLALFATRAWAEPLRTVHDAARNRLWVLEADGVYLHEAANKTRFELPGWIYATEPYACSPDLAVDAQGAAVVTSNIAPVVWRIEPAKLQVTKHELTLDADADKDVGFTGLASLGQAAYLGVGAYLTAILATKYQFGLGWSFP